MFEARELWRGRHVVIPARLVKGEEREAIVGKIYGEIHVAIFTKRAGRVRLISCHRADKRWERIYERYLQKGEEGDLGS